ncbi:MAG: GC-type dockerin domain-anchored protein [Phycisphaerales bacterium JB040]
MRTQTAVVACVVGQAMATPPPRAFDLDVVASTRLPEGAPVPGFDFESVGVDRVRSYHLPELSDRSGAMFGAQLFDPVLTEQAGEAVLMRGDPNAPLALSAIAQQGDTAPGLVAGEVMLLDRTFPFDLFFSESDADAAFAAYVSNPDQSDQRRVVFRRTDDNQPSVLFDPWNPPTGIAPGEDLDRNIRGRNDPVVYGRDGSLGVIVNYADGSDAIALVTADGQFGEELARTGDAAPVFGSETAWNYHAFGTLSASGDGRLLWDARLLEDGGTAPGSGIFTSRPATGGNPVAISGDEVPGYDPPRYLQSLTYPQGQSATNRPLFAGEQRIVFFAAAREEATNFGSYVLLEWNAGVLSVLKQEGDPVPGGAPGDEVKHIGDYQTDEDGNVLIMVQADDEVLDLMDGLIERTQGGDERWLMNERRVPIDLEPLAGLVANWDLFTFAPMAALGDGHVAAWCWVEDDLGEGYAAVMSDAAPRPRLILRHGDALEVGPGDVRIVDAVFVTPSDGRHHGRPASANAHKQVLLSVRFEDTTEALVLATPNAYFCPAEFTGDGVLDLGDISGFVSEFLSGSRWADVNGDSVVDQGDIHAFVERFLAGC